jgi:hypothetical protein
MHSGQTNPIQAQGENPEASFFYPGRDRCAPSLRGRIKSQAGANFCQPVMSVEPLAMAILKQY